MWTAILYRMFWQLCIRSVQFILGHKIHAQWQRLCPAQHGNWFQPVAHYGVVMAQMEIQPLRQDYQTLPVIYGQQVIMAAHRAFLHLYLMGIIRMEMMVDIHKIKHLISRPVIQIQHTAHLQRFNRRHTWLMYGAEQHKQRG